VAAVALAATVAGCTWLGPEIVRSGRPAYNDAILATNDEQLLQLLASAQLPDGTAGTAPVLTIPVTGRR
jgi:hypothetical protein